MSACMKKVSSNKLDASSVKVEWPKKPTLRNPHDADDHGGLAGPLCAFASGVNHTLVCANPAQAGGASIALADGVCGDKSEAAVVTQ